MKVLGFIFAGILLLVLCLGLSWVIEGNDFFLYQYFAPKEAAVQRQVFEQSKSYNQGMIQELENMEFAYIQADADHKKGLGALILHRAADYDETKLPPDLRTFIDGLKTPSTVEKK